MAKGSNLITNGLRGKLGRYQFVKDPRYGEYMRSARGTFKPAVLNEACKASSQRMVIANAPAKAVYDAVRTEHRDYFLWNRLVSIFRLQLKAGTPFNVDALRGMECSKKATLNRLMDEDYHVAVDNHGGLLDVSLTMKRPPDWRYLKWKEYPGYRVSLLVVYPYLDTGYYVKQTFHSAVFTSTAALSPLQFASNVPEGARCYILFMLVTACQNGEVVTMPHARGMRVVATGAIGKD